MNNPQVSDSSSKDLSIYLPSDAAISNLRQTNREMAEWNRELAEIEAQLDKELYAQKLARINSKTLTQT